MVDFLVPNGHVSMNDLMVTAGAVLAGLVAWRQKAKDQQIKTLMETIEFLKIQVTYLQNQIAPRVDGK